MSQWIAMAFRARQTVFAVALLLNVFVAGYGFFILTLLLLDWEDEGPIWFVMVPAAAISAIIALIWHPRGRTKDRNL